MQPHIHMITLGVKDLEKASEFYQNGLKFPLSQHSNENIRFFELQGTWLSLYNKDALAKDANQRLTGLGFSGITLAHIVSTKEEVHQILELAASSGGIIIKSPIETHWGGYSGYFADLDDYLWEVAYNPHFSIQS